MVTSAHDLGMKVNVWTVNKREDIEKMIDLKVDYITTDEPLLVRESSVKKIILAGIYLHIPFCKSRCIYCDFYSQTDETFIDKFTEAIVGKRVCGNRCLQTKPFGQFILEEEHRHACTETFRKDF